jgi:BphX-like
MNRLRWWMRIVGAFYMLQFVMVALVRAPIKAQAPPDTLARAAAGDPLARFLIDTWVTFGLEMLAIGVGLLVASRWLAEARPLVWTVIGIELSRGIAADLYMLLRGLDPAVPLVWMVIHAVVIASAIWCLKSTPTPATSAMAAAKSVEID